MSNSLNGLQEWLSRPKQTVFIGAAPDPGMPENLAEALKALEIDYVCLNELSDILLFCINQSPQLMIVDVHSPLAGDLQAAMGKMDAEVRQETRLVFWGESLDSSQGQAPLLYSKQGASTLKTQLWALMKVYQDQLSQMLHDLDRLAHSDALTGLANRRIFNENLNRELAVAHRRNSKLALLYLDLDKFKTVNDTLGHDVGDMLLQDVTDRLLPCIRDTDTLARLGGDEFAILLVDLARWEDVAIVADRIVQCIQPAFAIKGNDIHIGVSVGVAPFPEAGETAIQLAKSADVALYNAKEAGRNCYRYYTKKLNEEHLQRMKLETDLRFALERDEFFMVYQPQYHLETQQLYGIEAMIRWRHPERGVVSPNQFVPLLEETGLIIDVGNWALEAACRDFSKWQSFLKERCFFSLNLSSRQVANENTIGFLEKVLKKNKLPSDAVVLELTESSVMNDLNSEESVVKKLSDRGFKLCIDDFGTGYSSLGHLRKLPVNKIKIDRTFTAGMLENNSDGMIVESIIRLGHSLKLDVIAEGVKDDAQKNALIDQACMVGQGALFALPLTAAEMEKHLKKD